MNKIRYLVMCIFRMNYRELFRTVSKVHGICGKNRVYLLFDIVKCGLRYSAGYKDYLLYQFYDLPDSVRATYITRGISNTINRTLNDENYYHFFDHKAEFYKTFSPFIRRGWINFETCSFDEFATFMETREEVIAKPDGLCCGQGVEKLKKSDFKTLRELYDHLKRAGAGLVEDVVIQHPEMQRMNAGSVNTIRVGTVMYREKATIVYAYIRIGNSDRPVDNLNAGGMCAPIDLETGKIARVAYDKEAHTYAKHPRSGCEIVGFQIPYWEQIKAMCLEAAPIMPQIGYVGWDVAVTADGPLFIEGNTLPGHDILQLPPHLPADKTGMLPIFRKLVPDLPV